MRGETTRFRSYTVAPPVRIDPDGLPHCVACRGEDALCNYHRQKLNVALGQLRSAALYGQATADLRYVIRAERSPRGTGE